MGRFVAMVGATPTDARGRGESIGQRRDVCGRRREAFDGKRAHISSRPLALIPGGEGKRFFVVLFFFCDALSDRKEPVATEARLLLYLDGPAMSIDTPARGLTREPVGNPAFSPAGTASQMSKSPDNMQ